MESTLEHSDKIHIRDLMVRCIIGINEEEREKKQDVIINITLYCDIRKACRTDSIKDSVNYKTVKKDVISLVENSSFYLLERLAEEVAALCLKESLVKKVIVTLDKPGALRFARSVAVEIVREK